MIRKKKAAIELLQKKNQLLEENYQALHQTYEADSRLYHDIHNHLNLLYQMLEQQQFEEAQQYIRSISTPVHMLSRQIEGSFTATVMLSFPSRPDGS